MESLNNLYEQYYQLIDNCQKTNNDEYCNDLLRYNITEEYYNKVNRATDLLRNFYDNYMSGERIKDLIFNKINDKRPENIKFCILIDVLRCYDGLSHPTSFTTPEGVALMILLGKFLEIGRIESYEQLGKVKSSTTSLIDIIPYLSEVSGELGHKYSLFVSTIFKDESPEIDTLYRKILYNLCKRIAEVDNEISLSEQEWLNEIALLNDDNPDNDIDVSGM